MQTVNFTCGHCDNLMAVTADLLGQHVRCPHCQQVVLAPAPSALPAVATPVPAPLTTEPDALSFSPAGAREEDSIFGPKETPDALFGDPKPAALEVPPEPAWVGPGDGAPIPSLEADASSAPVPESAFGPPASGTLVFGQTNHHAAEGMAVSSALEAANHENSATGLTVEAPLATQPANRRASGGGKSAAVSVLIFLVPYSIFMTGVAAYYYWKVAQVPPHPLEYLPDWPGEHPGTTHKGQGKVVYERVQPSTPLPPQLRLGLHKTIRIGSLEVTPEKVEKRQLLFRYHTANVNPNPPRQARSQQELSRDEALVLTLRLKNVSDDDSFFPTDPGFVPHWQKGQPVPYTFLEVGSNKFYGGPGKKSPGEFLDGQDKDDQPLNPGEERVTVICTDPDNTALMNALANYRGPLLWRVQLRRGLAKYKNLEKSVAAVIGVEFSPNDIQKGS